MKYAVYKTKWIETEEHRLYGACLWRVELVYMGQASSMQEAKRFCFAPILERIKK
jgi:hypothetical protein